LLSGRSSKLTRPFQKRKCGPRDDTDGANGTLGVPTCGRVIERRISTTEMPEGACMWATREAEKMIHSHILSGPNTYLKREGPKFHGEIKHLVSCTTRRETIMHCHAANISKNTLCK
jgi:hypothetical protein